MRRSPGFWSRNSILIIAPLAVLTVLGLILGRSVFGGSASPDDSSLASTELAIRNANPIPDPSTAAPTQDPEPEVSQAPPPVVRSVGLVTGRYTVKGPAKTVPGAFTVFVVDGPKRVVRTDVKPPFQVRLDTAKMPEGTYTVSVMTVIKGESSLVSTSTLKVRHPKPKKPATPVTTPQAGVTTSPGKPAAGKPSAGKPAKSTSNPPAPSGGSFAAQVLALTNRERAKAGCPALTSNSELTRAAQAHSADMAKKDYFSHDSQDGRSPFDRMTGAGYSFSAAAENIAMGQATPADVMDAWMNSAGHQANILNCTYTNLGVGYAVGDGAPYWTQDFGKPL
jgi:uncharacterized protein YkwD